jgi:aminoglycoside 6'-N-acetyltransferase
MAHDLLTAQITTERLVLRRLMPADVAPLAAYRSRPDIARFQGWGPGYSVEKAAALVAEMAWADPDRPGKWFQFAITAGGVLVGDCGFRPDPDEPRITEIGFTIGPDHQRQGYAREAVAALVAHLFTVRGKHRIVAVTDVDNDKSRRVLEALGFRREAHLVDNTWVDGSWRNDYVFALLEYHWSARRAGALEWHDELHWGDLEQLDDRIYEFNMAATGYRDGLGFTGLIRDEHGGVIAGIVGFTWGGAGRVIDLWVNEAHRGHDLGSALLQGAEDIARRRGANVMLLDTHTFQAPEFYPRHGYKVIGRLDDFPSGHGQVTFSKRLDERA